jgi:hypothetical protein
LSCVSAFVLISIESHSMDVIFDDSPSIGVKLILTVKKKAGSPMTPPMPGLLYMMRMQREVTTLFRGNSTRTATYRGKSTEEWATECFRGCE